MADYPMMSESSAYERYEDAPPEWHPTPDVGALGLSLDKLDKAIEDARSVADRIGERLAPVLRAEHEQNAKNLEVALKQLDTRSPLTQRIDHIRRRVEELASNSRALLERVDL